MPPIIHGKASETPPPPLETGGPYDPADDPRYKALSPGERALWQSLCPDPNLILGFDNLQPSTLTPATQLVERRFRTIPRSQEFYYERAPVQMVRGWQQYLFDADGRPAGEVAFEEVTFSYPSAADSSLASLERGFARVLDATPGLAVLREVSFLVAPGETHPSPSSVLRRANEACAGIRQKC